MSIIHTKEFKLTVILVLIIQFASNALSLFEFNRLGFYEIETMLFKINKVDSGICFSILFFCFVFFLQ